MPAITSPPTQTVLSTYGASYSTPNLNSKQRLAILVQAKMVLLNYKGGTNYIGNHNQLTQDALTAFKGMTPENWADNLGQSDNEVDPGPVTVGAFVTQANFRDSTNMPAALNTILTLLGHQLMRPVQIVQLQNVYLDYKLMAIWA